MEYHELKHMKTGQLSKVAIQQLAKNSAEELLEEGMIDPIGDMVKARRISEYVSAYSKVLESAVRGHVGSMSEKFYEIDNAKLSLGSTGDRLDYADDAEWSALKEKMVHRETLLKLAFKSKEDVVDSDGAIVPVIRLKSASKETLTIKF